MSTSNPDPKTDFPPHQPIKGRSELRVVQHSMLFYWWPVWAVGFLMFLVTLCFGERMALVPTNSTVKRTSDGYQIAVKGEPPPRASGEKLSDAGKAGDEMPVWEAQKPWSVRMVTSRYLGILFIGVLLLVIVITNVPLRGLWSVVVIVLLILGVVIISLIQDAWASIFHWFGLLDIHINAAGYLTISLVLFAIWAVTVFWFDQQIYIIFTPGLMKVRETIGSGETAYDTSSMTIEHLRDDIFRHWILGLGSGDLVVHPAGPQSREIRLNNVLFVSSRLQLIEQFKRTGVVVGSG
jgi:hypothetical protein